MARRSEDIEREIERTRADMTRTAAEIERRFRADHMVDTAMDWVRSSPQARSLMTEVGDAVARNPLPVVLIGIGAAWLAWDIATGGAGGGGRPARRLDQYRPMRSRMGAPPSAERHHTHVEDGGQASWPGHAPDADAIVGRAPGNRSARQSAEVFQAEGARAEAGGAAPRGYGASARAEAAVPGTDEDSLAIDPQRRAGMADPGRTDR